MKQVGKGTWKSFSISWTMELMWISQLMWAIVYIIIIYRQLPFNWVRHFSYNHFQNISKFNINISSFTFSNYGYCLIVTRARTTALYTSYIMKLDSMWNFYLTLAIPASMPGPGDEASPPECFQRMHEKDGGARRWDYFKFSREHRSASTHAISLLTTHTSQ